MSKTTQQQKQDRSGGFIWQKIQREVLGGAVLVVLIKAIMIWRYGMVATLNLAGGYDYVVAVIMGGLIGNKISKNKKPTAKQAVFYGGMSGIYFGIIVAVIDAVLYRNTWAVWNLLKRPILFAILMGAAATIVFTIRYRNGVASKT